MEATMSRMTPPTQRPECFMALGMANMPVPMLPLMRWANVSRFLFRQSNQHVRRSNSTRIKINAKISCWLRYAFVPGGVNGSIQFVGAVSGAAVDTGFTLGHVATFQGQLVDATVAALDRNCHFFVLVFVLNPPRAKQIITITISPLHKIKRHRKTERQRDRDNRSLNSFKHQVTFQLARESWCLNELVFSLMVAKNSKCRSAGRSRVKFLVLLRAVFISNCFHSTQLSRLCNRYQLRSINISPNCLINLIIGACLDELDFQWRFLPLSPAKCQLAVREPIELKCWMENRYELWFPVPISTLL